MDKIFIKGLELEAIVGIYAHERSAKQPIYLDINLYTDISLPAKTGLISDAIDYDLVVARVSHVVEDSAFDLIESLIEKIAEVILEEFKVQKVSCTLYKPQAVSKAESVGITIVRAQPRK